MRCSRSDFWRYLTPFSKSFLRTYDVPMRPRALRAGEKRGQDELDMPSSERAGSDARKLCASALARGRARQVDALGDELEVGAAVATLVDGLVARLDRLVKVALLEVDGCG